MIRAIAIAVFPAFLAGCASTPPRPTSADHPANADASATPLPHVTDLRADRPASAHEADPFTATATATAPAPAQGDMTDHSGHQMPSVKEPERASTTQAAAMYVCPMHPEVTASEPSKCPKCKMKLVKKGGQ